MNYRKLSLNLALFLPALALLLLAGSQIRDVRLALAQDYPAPPSPLVQPISPLAPVNGVLGPPTITVADVAAAGYTNVTVQSPAASAYLEPTIYFRVNEVVISPAWSNSANLLSVLIYPFTYATDFTTGGLLVEKEYYSRYEACVTRTGYYICVTGPDRTRVNALATNLSKK